MSRVALLVGKRLALAVPLVWVVMTLTFVLLRLAPGDPTVAILGERATVEQYEQARSELGLDRPFLEQYGVFLGDLVRGEVGTSLLSSREAADVVLDRLPVTLSLTIGATVMSVVLGVALGVFAALRRGWAGQVSQVGVVIGQAVPNFWLGLVLVVVFAVQLDWFPPNGYTPLAESAGGWAHALILPIVALGLAAVGAVARMTRGSMVAVLDREYIRTLRAAGLPRSSIVFKHALKNAAIPVTTIVGLRFIGLLSSAVVIEQVFALPGVGSLAVSAASQSDYPVMQALVFYLTLAVVVVNLVVDLIYAWLNPKVRVS